MEKYNKARILVAESIMRSSQEELEDIRFDIRELHKLLSDEEENSKEIDDAINEIIVNFLLMALPGTHLYDTVTNKIESGVSIDQIEEVLDPSQKK